MFSLDHLLIQDKVITTHFACDVKSCKGACCTLEGGAGAPLLQEELQLIREAIPAASKYLSEKSKRVLESIDPVEGAPGDEYVACIDDKDCVFVTYEADIAVCSIEKAYHAGESTFRKPLSCHLFPIRVANFGGPYLYYDQFEECAPGRAYGQEHSIPLLESLKDAIVRGYGLEMYNKMVQLANGTLLGDEP